MNMRLVPGTGPRSERQADAPAAALAVRGAVVAAAVVVAPGR